MSETAAVAQEESRTVTVSARVTKAEKDALRVVAALDETTESDLLRDCTMAEVMARADEIREMRERFRESETGAA